MKKAILTIGLFTSVLASTSFAAPSTSNSSIADDAVITTIDVNQDSGENKKLDSSESKSITSFTNPIIGIDGNGGQSTGGNKKQD